MRVYYLYNRVGLDWLIICKSRVHKDITNRYTEKCIDGAVEL